MLPVGYSCFSDLIRHQLDFIDKTLFIKEIFDNTGTQVSVITRPRRFGKTLNLSMLHCFLAAEVNLKPTQGLFDGLKIAQVGDHYMQHQGEYPVIYIKRTLWFYRSRKNRFKQRGIQRMSSILFAVAIFSSKAKSVLTSAC